MIDEEKVRELVDIAVGNYTVHDDLVSGVDNSVNHLTKWLEQNQLEPVGLSDEQVNDLTACLFNNVHQTMTWTEKTEDVIRDYLKSQTFAQPEPALSNSSVYAELYREYQGVKKELEHLKSQQVQPDWESAPNWANWLAQDSYGKWIWFEKHPTANIVSWFDNGGESKAITPNPNWQQTLQQHPKSTPIVEVGQVWKGEDIKVRVGCLGRVSKNGEESIAFVDVDTNELKTWLLKTFLAKFERVGGSDVDSSD